MKKILILLLPFLFIIGCGNDNSQETENAAGVAKEVNTADKTDVDSVENYNNEDTNNDSTEATDEFLIYENIIMNKETYINKLDEVEKSLVDLRNKAENGTQAEMNIAQDEIYKKWDGSLNEVYRVLETNLSNEDMELLRVDQRKWIEERDKAAEKASEEFKGGSLEPYVYSKALADWTKERSYSLVNEYMD